MPQPNGTEWHGIARNSTGLVRYAGTEPDPDPDPVVQHNAMHAALQQSVDHLDEVTKSLHQALDADITANANRDAAVVDLTKRLAVLEAGRGTSWPELIARWTSRKWLIGVLSGLIAVVSLAGYTFGPLDGRVAAFCGAAATFLNGLFLVMEGRADAEAVKAAAPPGPDTSVVSVKQQ